MKTKHDWRWMCLFILIFPAAAAGQTGQMDDEWPRVSLEPFVGGVDTWLRDDFVYGLRLVYRLDYDYDLQLTYGDMESSLDSSVLPAEFGEVDAGFEFVDLAIARHVSLRGDKTLLAYAGPGWASIDVESFPITVPPFDDPSDDFLTLNAGVGVEIPFSERFYFRPDLTLRWLDGKNELQVALTAAIGVRLAWRCMPDNEVSTPFEQRPRVCRKRSLKNQAR